MTIENTTDRDEMTDLEKALQTVAEFAGSEGERTVADWCIAACEELANDRERYIRIGRVAAGYLQPSYLSDDELAELGERITAAIEAAK